MQKHTIRIDEDLYREIEEYCSLNSLKVSSLCNEMLRDSIAVKKYGDIPFGVVGERKKSQPDIHEPEPKFIKVSNEEQSKPVEPEKKNEETKEEKPKVTVKTRKL